jgi:hypothetical protein
MYRVHPVVTIEIEEQEELPEERCIPESREGCAECHYRRIQRRNPGKELESYADALLRYRRGGQDED